MGAKCQSCGMPLGKDPAKSGTEADGGPSAAYCSFCYRDGAFIHPDFTVEEMQAHCIGELKKKGMPGVMAWIFTRGIPKLDRWNG